MPAERQSAVTQHLLTAAVEDAAPGALTDHVDTLQVAWRACRDRYPFAMTTGVILPDHLHAIVAPPVNGPHRAARCRPVPALLQQVVTGRSAGISLQARLLVDQAEIE